MYLNPKCVSSKEPPERIQPDICPLNSGSDTENNSPVKKQGSNVRSARVLWIIIFLYRAFTITII